MRLSMLLFPITRARYICFSQTLTHFSSHDSWEWIQWSITAANFFGTRGPVYKKSDHTRAAPDTFDSCSYPNTLVFHNLGGLWILGSIMTQRLISYVLYVFFLPARGYVDREVDMSYLLSLYWNSFCLHTAPYSPFSCMSLRSKIKQWHNVLISYPMDHCIQLPTIVFL